MAQSPLFRPLPASWAVLWRSRGGFSVVPAPSAASALRLSLGSFLWPSWRQRPWDAWRVCPPARLRRLRVLPQALPADTRPPKAPFNLDSPS
jgi:hypothetical protein